MKDPLRILKKFINNYWFAYQVTLFNDVNNNIEYIMTHTWSFLHTKR